MAFHNLPGQERVKRFLGLLVHSRRLPHALLFSGMPGVGKLAAALELAKLVNCRNRTETGGAGPIPTDCCDVCPSCRKIAGGTHPDLIRVARSGAYIKLAQIQDLRSRFRFDPFEAERRVVIIEEAQDLKEEAGNALLKLLEEPPRRNLFVLLAPEPQMLLRTIVSRCCHVRFQPLPKGLVRQLLVAEHHLDPATAAQAARLSEGSLSRALLWAEPQRLARRDTVLKRIRGLAKATMIDFFALSEQWAKEEADLQEDLESIKFWLREQIHSRIRQNLNAGTGGFEKAREWPADLAAETIFRLYTDLDRAQLDLRRFANKQLTLEGVLLSLKDALNG